MLRRTMRAWIGWGLSLAAGSGVSVGVVHAVNAFQPHQTAPPSFKNIQIAASAPGMSPCEPSIAVSRKNPSNIVAGVILDRAIYTGDGGTNWADVRLTSPFGVFGDPTLISDKDGNFYYFHLSSNRSVPNGHLDRIVCQKSSDGGKTWSSGASIGNNPPTQQDKQWAVAHPTKPYIYATWTQFDKYAAKEPTFRSNIYFSRSIDAGATWSPGLKINDISGDCLDDDGTTEGAVPAVGLDGSINVAWASHEVIWFDKSMDNGKTWLKHDIPIARQYGGWNMNIPGVNRSNGMPVLMADTSNSKYKNSLYVVWGDQRNAESDSDILFARSTDGGVTWSAPKTVNQDNTGRHQFLPWMAVDSTTGYIYLVYYDRRDYDDARTDVYIAYSTDGGSTFTERKISETPFTPMANRFLGDYNNISAHAGIIAPIWTRMDEGRTSVWTAVIKQSDLISK